MTSGNEPARKGIGRRLRPFAAALLGSCLAAAPLLAQDAPGAQTSSLPTAESLGLPSERTAFTLSLTGTLASWGLLLLSWGAATGEAPSETSSAIGIASIAGVMVGPSLGFFYGGCWGRGLLTSLLRLGVTAGAVAYAMENDEKDNSGLAIAMLGVLVGSAIYDCATVRSAVRKHNAAHIARRGLNVAVTPFALRKGGGLQVRLSF